MKIIEIFENTSKKLEFLGADYGKVLQKEKELKQAEIAEENKYHFAKGLPITAMFLRYIENTEEIINKSDDMRSELYNAFQQIAENLKNEYVPKEEYMQTVSSLRDWGVELVAIALQMDKDTISVLLNQKKLTKRRIKEIILERNTKIILEDYLERGIDIEQSKPLIKRRLNVDEQWEDLLVAKLCKQYYRESLQLEMARNVNRTEREYQLPSDETEEYNTYEAETETEPEPKPKPEKEEPQPEPKPKPKPSKKDKEDIRVKSKKEELEAVAEFAKKQKKKNVKETEPEDEDEEEQSEETSEEENDTETTEEKDTTPSDEDFFDLSQQEEN